MWLYFSKKSLLTLWGNFVFQVNHFSTPFGSSVTGKSTKNYTVKKGTSSSSSSRKTSSHSVERTEERSSQTTKRSTLTTSASCEESTIVNCTVQRGRHRSNSSCRWRVIKYIFVSISRDELNLLLKNDLNSENMIE